MVKFKYYDGNIGIFTNRLLKEDFGKSVTSPLPYENLPTGIYLIRGDKKSYRKEYWKLGENWYLVDNVTKDNGHYYVDAGKFELFPRLSEKQWSKLNSIPKKCLSYVWRRYLYGYNFWMRLRTSQREIKLNVLKYRKLNKT